MNPQDDQQNPNPQKSAQRIVLPPIRTAGAPDSTRQAAANILSDQARAIAEANTPIKPQSSNNNSNPPNVNSYNHLTASDGSKIGDLQNQTQSNNYDDKITTEIATKFRKEQEKTEQKNAESNAKNLAKIDPENAPTEDEIKLAHKRYHESWQNYYQKYYEKYYVSAMSQQNTAFNEKLAEISEAAKSSAENNSKTQQEAMDELRQDIRGKIKQSAKKARKSRHFIPAIAAVVVILLATFIQFNGLIFAQIATFISPGDTTDQNIIIGTGANQPVGPDSRIIIPKINVNAPVIYGLTDLSEESTQTALQNGPVHYPVQGASASPGQNGNTAILGHSSADWFLPGNYKFIFVQLNQLSEGDLFYLDYKETRYTYRVTRSEIINPDQLDRLAMTNSDKPYATLITCDPVGTALRRLLVFGEQISPDPNKATNSNSDNSSEATANGSISGNPPTLFERLFGK